MKTNWLVHNFWTKLGALILAIVLWFYVAGEERVEKEFRVPVRFYLNEGMVITEQDVSELNVLTGGRKEVVSGLQEKEILVTIDFRKPIYAEPQKIVFSINRGNIPLKPEISVLKIVPESVAVRIDRQAEKALPVEVVTKGVPAPGYKLEGFVLDPVSTMVNGPSEYLNTLSHIKTEAIDITGRRKTFKRMIPLELIPVIGERPPPQFVEVVVMIGEEKKR